MKKLIFLGVMLAAATGSFCQRKPAEVHNVSPAQFKIVMDSIRDEVIIDLRTPEELKDGKIQGALEIDFFGPKFEPSITALDRNKVYLLYCASGARSGETSELMSKMGFKTLYNMNGGFREWVKNKMPVGRQP